jgi:hypothetical protein
MAGGPAYLHQFLDPRVINERVLRGFANGDFDGCRGRAGWRAAASGVLGGRPVAVIDDEVDDG